MAAWAKRELLAYLDRVEPAIRRLTHYELLDIAPDATGAQIRDAFHAAAVRLHPDLYRQTLSAAEHERLTAVYARIAEAYMVLRDPKQRSAYRAQTQPPIAAPDRARTARPSTEGDALRLLPPKAQRLYWRAQAALRTGDATSAVLNLRMAAASAPRSALIRQALDEALARLRRES